MWSRIRLLLCQPGQYAGHLNFQESHPAMRQNRTRKFAELLAFVMLMGAMLGCERTAARRTVHSIDGDNWPMLIADYQPWFGDHKHIGVGYNSQDPAVLKKQIDEAKAMGIGAFIVDWYGNR